jgi:Ser/Thr protein kinase RdoA (MazF antagonist)
MRQISMFHKDVAARNVLIEHERQGIRLIDFGIAGDAMYHRDATVKVRRLTWTACC